MVVDMLDNVWFGFTKVWNQGVLNKWTIKCFNQIKCKYKAVSIFVSLVFANEKSNT